MDEFKKEYKGLIKENELSILSSYGIKITKDTSIDEILLLIDRFLDDADIMDEEYEKIDAIANNLAERKYYYKTHK